MLTTLALLTAAVLPQSPTAQGQEPLRHAGLLPKDSLVAMELAPGADFRSELEQTVLWTSLQEAFDQPACRELLSALRAPIAEKAGDGIRGIDLLDQGLTLSFSAPQNGGDFGITAVLETGSLANRLASALDERAARVNGGLERKDRKGTSIWLSKTGSRQTAIALAGTTLLFGSPPELLDAALERRAGHTVETLATSPTYLAYTEHARPHLHPGRAFTLFCDFGSLCRSALASAPAIVKDGVGRWLGRTGLDGIGASGVIVDVADGRVRERVILDLPTPRPPLLAAIFPEQGQIGLDAATLAPRDIAAFSSIEINLRSLYVELMKAIDAAEPRTGAQIRRTIRIASDQLGIDVESDLIYALGNRVVALQWPSHDAAGANDWVYVIDTDRAERLSAALTRLKDFESGKLGAFDLFFQHAGGVGLAVGKGSLVLADSERTLRRWLGDQRVPTPHPEVRSVLIRLADGGIGCGWLNLRTLMADALQAVGRYGAALDNNNLGHRALSRIASTLTPLGWSLYTEPTGISVHFESTSGFLSQILLSGLIGAAEDAINDPALAHLLDATRSTADAREVRIAQVLAALQIAQRHYSETHSTFGDLEQLAQEKLLDADFFQPGRAPGIRTVGDSCVTVICTKDKLPHWVGVVWPSDARTGDVFAVSDEHGPMRNELVARSRGMTEPMLRDVFNRGDIALGLTPGWRALDLGEGSSNTIPAAPGSGDTAVLGIIAALEKRGAESAPELVKYLDAESPRVVARAAYALGKLRAGVAVPRLLEIAVSHSDAEVRQQSMRALLQFGDRRTVQTSMRLLGDPDPVVRTLAATNLGRLKATESADALIALAGRSSTDAGNDDAVAAALIALGELGDPGVLLRASGSYKEGGKKSDEAITWLFQTLSPTLEGSEEAKTLMGVLDHGSTLLRRYAIQRLGELKDPNTVSALESRLAVENDQLRPLVEISLSAVRGVMVGEEESGFAASIRNGYLYVKGQVQAGWADPKTRGIAIATLSGLVVAIVGLVIATRRQRRRRKGENWAAKAREVAGPAPRTPVRLRPRYEDYKPEYAPGENWDTEISRGDEDDWPVDEEYTESTEESWQDEQVEPSR
ncbi:MAG: HEAT repeat domain-containing protein [Planctomycetota bacterium]